MELAKFDNTTGEGVVSFEPWITHGPDYGKNPSRWMCHLTVAGERVFRYGCPCGTCGIVFEKVRSPAQQVNDAEAVRLLGTLDSLPPEEVLRRLARVLRPGLYYPTVLEGTVRLVEPGSAEDYFATDVVRLFPASGPGTNTSYYRLGSDRELTRTNRTSGPHKALVTAVLMPIHEPSQLQRERIEYWKRQREAGTILTALAVSVLDNQQPAMDVPDETYPYAEQFLLTNCVLDGHHRIQAAAESGAPVRILSLFTREFSVAERTEDIVAVLRGYALPGTGAS